MMSLRRIMAILRKELLQLRRDRLTFGMVIMIPLIQLVLFGYAINTNVRHIPAAVVDQSDTGLSRALIQMVEATQVVEFTQRFATIQEAEIAIIRSDVRAALIIPNDLAQRVVRNPAVVGTLPSEPDRPIGRPVAQWLVDGSDTVIAASVKSLRNMPLAELFRRPANAGTPTFEVALFYNPEQRSAVNIVPGLVGIILTMTMIMFTSAAIVRETERGNMEMLINTPVKPVELMIGKIIPYIVIGFVQAAIILGLGYFVFDVPINGSFAALFVVTLLFILASLSLGLVISTIAKNQLQAMQMTVFVLLPSILLSGFMFPYEGMPKVAQHIADVFPATHFMRVIRGVVLREATLAEVDFDALWLLGFTVVGMAVASLRFRKNLD
tara:strand:- start:859 stop:2004 length:1146 start_codon:yes stop_codon:yes gene_type:complete